MSGPEAITSDDLLVRLRAICDPPNDWNAIVDKPTLLALVECAEALRTVPIIAGEAFDDWDNDRDMRVGKILKALSGRAPRYRNDIDPIHYALAKLEAL